MVKRILLFMAVNLLVMLTITTILSVLGIGRYITPYGLDYSALAAFCLIWGMVGSLISLSLSRIMAKMMMGVQVIDPNSGGQEGELVRTVYNLARAARLPAMPEVGIYESPEVNAFATGPMKSRSLVAVSSGLLDQMNQAQLEGVLGHEIAHIANGDMVTMTLLQGVINAFVMFFSRVIAFAITQAMSRGDNEREGSRNNWWLNYAITMVLEIVFSILGMILVAYFSRRREFRADAGGAQFAGRENMVGALRALQTYVERVDESHQSLRAFKINGGRSKFFALFSTHPPLAERIERLSMGRG
jgi:heat shock protein HtpX